MIEGIDAASGTIIGTLGGFAGALVNSVAAPIIDHFKQKQKQKHELAVMDKQLAAAKENTRLEIQKHEATAGDTQLQALLAHDAATLNSPVKGLVRPLYAFTMLGFFLLYKFMMIGFGIWGFVQEKITMQDLAGIVWDASTALVFGAVVTFYFSSRGAEKFMALLRSNR